jgi:hypothetical protein
VRLDVEHRDQIGGEHAFARVVDGKLAREIDVAARAFEECLQGFERTLLGHSMSVALRRPEIHLGRQLGDDARAFCRAELPPDLERRRPRVVRIDTVRRRDRHAAAKSSGCLRSCPAQMPGRARVLEGAGAEPVAPSRA